MQYLNLFIYVLHVQVKRFPLTSIIDVIYNEQNNPLEFKLVFQNDELILEAPDQHSCKKWVERIEEGMLN